METYGFLERGTLIQVGTILKWANGATREITTFHARPTQKSYGRDVYYFIINTTNQAGVEREYDKADLEEMVAKGELKIYNES